MRLRLAVFFALTTVLPSLSYADLARGKELFGQRCASCHGNGGAGDGPVAAAFPADQKPRNLTEAKFKYATDDAKMLNLLHKGGSGVGLSALMPPQPDLPDADLKSIIEFVRTLKK